MDNKRGANSFSCSHLFQQFGAWITSKLNKGWKGFTPMHELSQSYSQFQVKFPGFNCWGTRASAQLCLLF